MSTKHKPRYKRLAQLKTSDDFVTYCRSVSAELPFDAIADSSLFQKPYTLRSGKTISNRFCILPMEGWDGTTDGRPTEYTSRRWRNFAVSGAKMLWGCEAVAVRPEGRANPNQLVLNTSNLDDYRRLRDDIEYHHRIRYTTADDLLVGLQLTHSGRFCKPNDKWKTEPMILYHHPFLDRKLSLSKDYPIISDDDIDRLIDDFIKAAGMAQEAGFHFVDIKHCHGYLGHEFLSARSRTGKYGGTFENRTRFLRNIVEGIRASTSGLDVGVRLSAFDWIPFIKGENGEGIPSDASGQYDFGFGTAASGVGEDLTETFLFLEMLRELEIELVCITAGSPYYNPHIQRPALFPPSDGYIPPEDPLVGVARQIRVTAEIKKSFPDLCIVGSAYSYLQEWLPNVAQAVLRSQMVDFVGLGRLALSYPTLAMDIMKVNPLKRDKLCRTFSDCTTAPRNGMISGCFPLDDFYKNLPEAEKLKAIKLEA